MACADQTPPIQPLVGLMNTRDLPAALTYGQWRFRGNFSASPSGKLCRRVGWRRLGYLLDPTGVRNEDLHDQLLTLQTYYSEAAPPSADSGTVSTFPSDLCGTTPLLRTTPRQPITLLFEAVSTDSSRRLIAATQNRIYVQRASAGNWEIISDAYGGTPQTGLPERRWKAAQVNDYIAFVNGLDAPLSYPFDGPVLGCAMQRASPIASAAEIGMTTANVIASWKGILFFGDTTMDGVRVRNRVLWGDLLQPLNLVPSNASIAGYQDLDYGETILAMKELGDFLFLYSTRGIWQVSYVGGDQVFQFTRKYSSDTGAACLAFPNTLVSIGDSHLYLGRDAIYLFNQFLPSPDRPDWMHAASGHLFETINTRVCEAHNAVFSASNKEYWVSWVKTGETFPSETLCVNVDDGAKSCDYIDHGFTAMVTFNLDTRPDIGEYVLEKCICTQAELDELSANGSLQKSYKAGVNCQPIAPADCELDTSVPIWTYETMDLDGRVIENFFKETPDEGTMCDFLLTLGLDEICNECNQATPLCLASSTDWCLKEVADVYFRERCTVFTACGQYTQDGYTSLMRSGAIRGKTEGQELKMTGFNLIFNAALQTVPSVIIPRIGVSGTPQDSNNPICAIRWRELSSRALACATQRTEAQHIAANTAPYETDSWQFLFTGRNLYLELRIDGIGGASCFSSIEPDISGRVLGSNF